MNFIKKSLTKYQNISAPAKASLWFVFSNVLTKGIALITTPIFTRLLTTEQYGVYTVYSSWYAILIILASLNLFLGCYSKGLVRFEGDEDRFTSSLIGLSTTVTCVVFLVLFVGHRFFCQVFKLDLPYLIAMFIEILTISAYEFWANRERFYYRYKALVFTSILMALIASVGGVVFILLTEKYKTEAMIFSNVASKVIVGIIMYVLLMHRGKTFFLREYWLYGLKFNLPLIPHFLSNMILNQSDRLMINSMIGSGEAAIYSIGYTIAMMMQLITNAIAQTFAPYVYRELKAERYDGIRKNANFLALFTAVLCLIAMIFAPELVLIIGGEKYRGAIGVVIPVAACVFFIFLYNLFSDIEYYFERTAGISTATIVAAVCNLVLNYIFIRRFGYVAAGYTTILCYALLTVMHFRFYRKALHTCLSGIRDIYDIRFLLLVSLMVLAIMFFMIFLQNFALIRYLILMVIAGILFIRRRFILDKIREMRK